MKVTGTVTYRSRPVQGAKVVFTGPKDVPSAIGITDKDGKFTLMTYDAEDGAVPGTYNVTVLKSLPTQGGPPANETMEQAAKRAKEQKAMNPGNSSKSALPDRYADPAQSPLQYVVEKGKQNDYKIELKD